MSIRSKIAALALTTLAVTGSIASTISQAEAKQPGWVWGVGAGIATAAVVGSAVAASNDPYTAIAAAAGSPSTTPSASTSAAFGPATDLRT